MPHLRLFLSSATKNARIGLIGPFITIGYVNIRTGANWNVPSVTR